METNCIIGILPLSIRLCGIFITVLGCCHSQFTNNNQMDCNILISLLPEWIPLKIVSKLGFLARGLVKWTKVVQAWILVKNGRSNGPVIAPGSSPWKPARGVFWCHTQSAASPGSFNELLHFAICNIPLAEVTSQVFDDCDNPVSHLAHGRGYKHPDQCAPPVLGCFQEAPFWQFQDLTASCWGPPSSPIYFCISFESFHV